MRTVVLAYNEVGYRCLEVLLQSGDEVALVLTHAADPSEKRWFRSVKELAERHGIPTATPDDVNEPSWVDRIAAARPEALFSFYYRRVLGQPILDLPTIGAFNMHGSLLPHYRGRCPVNWALIHGETRTGVTLHEMIERPDAGPIVGQREIEIEPHDDALSLSHKVADQAAQLLEALLPGLRNGAYDRIPQHPDAGSTFGGRRPEDGEIDWTRPAAELHNLVRAVTDPWPGAFSEMAGRRLWIWRSQVEEDPGAEPPGTVLEGTIPAVRCGDGALILERWQWEGKKACDINEIGSWEPPPPGARLG